MKQSMLFVPTLRDNPKDAEISSHRILLKGGYIKQVAAGVYNYLPLGYKIIKNIENIVREEMDRIGASELLMPSLQPKDLWVESGRWDDYGKELIRLSDRHDRDFCLGPTHEEVVTEIIRDYVTSYKKLPLALYQIQTKFRDEYRPRFGIMRGREFIMKDLYTFHADDEDLDKWYLKVRGAYQRIFDRLDLTYRVVGANSGQIGGKSSEEFMVLCDIGEDSIIYSDESEYAVNIELVNLKEGDPSPDGKGYLKIAKGIEVGHIFKLGTKYSDSMKANFIDKDQKSKAIIMGCYGIGISRLLMSVLEQHNYEDHPLWPEEVTPFKIHILPLDKIDSSNELIARDLYLHLNEKYDCLYDDRDERPGVKFKDADLIGIKYRIIAGRKTSDKIFEFINVETNERFEMSMEDILKLEL
ncbi:MAG: proline--tRNA ligase [Bacilli bacterium]|jgi:prolyl-tRNA synthetase|nr:proline--tRNA ligase [Bacilli bacterium]MDD3121312.1 proline--tRNA ligase [Bacilli bacterium]MDD4063437.1 proline--tRNA ligase [Bacilli bacterium]MDD4482098.1 proline--tRNA ligase [Bacilli bacterium]MDY0363137.1 proline--tRNA ligase [Bacilli bacterium]